MHFPFTIVVGKLQPTALVQLKCSVISLITLATASGVAGFGVGILCLFVSNSPVFVFTIAALIPEPPTSIPNIFIIYYLNSLCLLASKITIAAATETFIESILPCIGILMFCVALSLQISDKPVASVPTTIAEGFL